MPEYASVEISSLVEKLKLSLNAARMHAYERNLRTGIVTKTFAPTLNDEWLPIPSNHFLVSGVAQITMSHEESRRLVLSEDREKVDFHVSQAIANGSEFEVEFRIEEPRGQIRWLTARGRAFYEPDGSPKCVYAVSQDITDRKLLEQDFKIRSAQLATTQDQLAIALDAAGMAAFEGFGQVSAIRSPAFKKLLGLAIDGPDVTEEILLRCVHPEDREMVRVNLRSPEREVCDEFRVVHQDGTLRWLLAKGSASRGIESLKSYIVMQDITDRKNSEEELRRKTDELSVLNRKLEDFSAIVAHDLKNPLSTLTMSADLLEDATPLSEAKENLSFIKRAATRMSNLVDDLLALVKLGKDQDFSMEVVSVKSVLDTVRASLKGVLISSQAELVIDIAEPYVQGHTGHLVRVFQNLIANALKFVDGKTPVIRVSFVEMESSWVVSIKDNGVGMDAKAMANLFQPFRRFHGSRFEGTGLGLSIVKDIVERHSGKIWVESEPDIGTTFYFSLPKSTKPAHLRTELRQREAGPV